MLGETLEVGRPWRWGDLGGGTLTRGPGEGTIWPHLQHLHSLPQVSCVSPGGPVLNCYRYLCPHGQDSPSRGVRQELGKCVPSLWSETRSSPIAAPHSSPFTWTEQGGTGHPGRGRKQKREGRPWETRPDSPGKSRIPTEESRGDLESPHRTRKSGVRMPWGRARNG